MGQYEHRTQVKPIAEAMAMIARIAKTIRMTMQIILRWKKLRTITG